MINAHIEDDKGKIEILGEIGDILSELVEISMRVLNQVEENYELPTEELKDSLHSTLVNTYVEILKKEMGVE